MHSNKCHFILPNEPFQFIPCGESVPRENPHAISVSLPLIDDVIGYEENNPAVKAKMQSGYPRFFRNKMVELSTEYIRLNKNISDKYELIPVASEKAAQLLLSRTNCEGELIAYDNFCCLKVEIAENNIKRISEFIQHTGTIVSSRRAQDFLLNQGILLSEFPEEVADSNSELRIKKFLASSYCGVNSDDISLACNGMNAIYSVLTAALDIQKKNNRNTILQFGWLYLDTMKIVEKFCNEKKILINISDLSELESWLSDNHSTVAAIITEVPTNPLIRISDLPRLSFLAKKYNIPLIVDSTLGTPFNIETMKFSDIVIESLTKFASGKGDLMMGSVLPNSGSSLGIEISIAAKAYIQEPYIKEIQRLAFSIESYRERVEKSAENTKELIAFLESNDNVAEVYHAADKYSLENFNKIRKSENAFPGIISVVFKKELRHYYDYLRFCKGPSLGTEFTLAMPYVYLAHYDMMKTTEGRANLNKLGVHPELLRISVGTESSELIIEEFIDVFSRKMQ